MDDIAGRYQCTAYIGTPGENDYHHVQVVPIDNGDDSGQSSYRWTNRAGVSWSLSLRSPDDGSLSVGPDCPYSSGGYVRCRVERAAAAGAGRREGRGRIAALFGPGNERYDICEEEGAPRGARRRRTFTLPTWKVREGLGEEGQRDRQRVRRHAFILPVSGTGDAGCCWGDLAFLAAIPPSAHMNGGRPTVLVPGELSGDDDNVLTDFLTRYEPTDIDIFHSEKIHIESAEQPNDDAERGPRISHQVWDSLNSVSVTLAKAAWTSLASLTRFVAAPSDDYAAALLASSLAARIGAPLFFVGEGWSNHAVPEIRPSEVIFVGKGIDDSRIFGWMGNIMNHRDERDDSIPRATFIQGVDDAISWLISLGLGVDYLAVVNPADRTANELCPSRKLSLTGPLYAARRNGLVVPVPNIPIMNEATDQEALNRTLESLRSVIRACPRPPGHVALVGGFDVVPTCKTGSDCNNSKIYAVTDIPYGQLDGNDCGKQKFRDMAIGRIYAETLCCGTLLAARTVNYELLLDGVWRTTIVECGTWGFPELSRLFQVAGFDRAPKHLRENDIRKARIVEAAAFLHKDHSSAVGLGNFVSNRTEALYSPAVVLSRGCHAAGIDEGNQWHGSVAGKMLGRGCVCFVGSPRSPTTSNTLTEVAFFHELLYGSERNVSVGRAIQSAFNNAMVHHLDGGHMNSYCLENEILLGDPALTPCFANAGMSNLVPPLPCAGVVTAVSASLDEGGIVTVVGPSEWVCTPIHKDQLKEWNFKGDLFTYVAPGAEQETIWCGQGYDKQELYHVVSVDLPAGVEIRNVTALGATEWSGRSPSGPVTHTTNSDWTKWWWPSGRHFLHHHYDGSTTVRLRLRLLDYDMLTGAIHAELKSARFRLELS